jgi:hypothetical protein
MPNTHRNNRWRITGAAHVIGFVLAPIALILVSIAALAVSMSIESDRLSPKSYEVQTVLNRDISTAIGHGMSVYFESLRKEPRKKYARECAGKLRAKLFDISLITDKDLDKTASGGARRSWDEVRRLVTSANSSSNDLNRELLKRNPNWKKVNNLSRSVADTLMESGDPHQMVVDNK